MASYAGLKGAVAIVTGAAGHIGSEVCRRLAADGVNIAIVDKNEDGAEKLAADLLKQFSVDARAFSCDLMDKKSFLKLRNDIDKAWGRADFIVNNAAFYDDMPGWGVPFEEEGYEAWENVMRVNALAPFFLVQAFSEMLKASEFSSVVNVSSIYAIVGPNPNLYEGTDMTNPCAYAVSKAGLIQLTRWLSTVLAPEVRVNAVTPGGVERGQADVFVNRYESRTPLGRMASEDDVAGAIAFLLSKDAGYITGQNLIVDGGWSSW